MHAGSQAIGTARPGAGRDATTRAGVGCLRERRLIPNGMRIAVALEIRADRMRRRESFEHDYVDCCHVIHEELVP